VVDTTSVDVLGGKIRLLNKLEQPANLSSLEIEELTYSLLSRTASTWQPWKWYRLRRNTGVSP